MAASAEGIRGIRVVRLTPPGFGAVAGLAVLGSGAAAFLAPFFCGRRVPEPGALRVGTLAWRGDVLDEIVLVARGPAHLEIFCHGGEAAVRRIRSALLAAGAAEANDARLWRAEAADCGLDRLQREAAAALPRALTADGVRMLLAQRNGALSRWARATAARARAAPEAVRAAVRRMRARAAYGRALLEPASLPIVGPPNAGKSTLFNRLLGEGRAVVSSSPGTTRDPVPAAASLAGIPVLLVDTAGLGPPQSALDGEAQARSRDLLARSACVIAVFDGTSGDPDAVRRHWRGLLPPSAVWVWNKCDVAQARPGPPWIPVSALTGEGVSRLIGRLAIRLSGRPVAAGQPCPFLPRHARLLEAAYAALTRGDGEGAARRLTSLVGAPEAPVAEGAA